MSVESGSIGLGQDALSGESMPGRPRDRSLSGELRNKKNKSESDFARVMVRSLNPEGTCLSLLLFQTCRRKRFIPY